jgi:hypothetical protein
MAPNRAEKEIASCRRRLLIDALRRAARHTAHRGKPTRVWWIAGHRGTAHLAGARMKAGERSNADPRLAETVGRGSKNVYAAVRVRHHAVAFSSDEAFPPCRAAERAGRRPCTRRLFDFLRDLLCEVPFLSTAKSSSFAPAFSFSRSQTGCAPLPAHVFPDLSRYLTATFRPLRRLIDGH